MKLNLKNLLFLGSLSVLLTSHVISQQKESDNSTNNEPASAEKKATPNKTTGKKAVHETMPVAISDNSFLIEEAYNQETGVMQSIMTCNWLRRPSQDIGCTLTQEFPYNDEKHQLGYTLPYSSLDSNSVKGVGDLLINYRYQLRGEKDWAAISPRVSLILQTGNVRRGLGSGSAGVQFNLPISKRAGRRFVWHFNAGATFLPRARREEENGAITKRSLSLYNLGGSVIWLAHKRANFVTEYLENFSSEIGDAGRVKRYNEHVINPGVRFALDLGSLQVVPGISVPTSFRGDSRRTGIFFYLSFEHPFKKLNTAKISDNTGK